METVSVDVVKLDRMVYQLESLLVIASMNAVVGSDERQKQMARARMELEELIEYGRTLVEDAGMALYSMWQDGGSLSDNQLEVAIRYAQRKGWAVPRRDS